MNQILPAESRQNPDSAGRKWLRSGSESLSHFSTHFWDVNQHPEIDVNNLFIDKTVKFETCICYVFYLMGAQKFHNN